MLPSFQPSIYSVFIFILQVQALETKHPTIVFVNPKNIKCIFKISILEELVDIPEKTIPQMAFAPVKISRMSLLKAVSLDLKGSSWVSTGCPLTPRADATRLVTIKSGVPRNHVICSAVQESSTPTAVSAETTEPKSEEKQEAKAAAKEPKAEEKTEAKDTPAKPKPAAKAPVKALPQMMEEDVIPPLRSILETQEDIKELELAFYDNQLVGSFQQNGIPYTFWAFFPDGNLTGPKGFSLSSYGSEVSTVEPFLVDEKKATAKHVVFWVEKRLAAQGIIPVWEK